MKSIFLAAIALAATVGAASTSYSQSSHRLALQDQSQTKNYTDPETGKSYLLTRFTPETPTAPTTGEIKLTITFTVKSTWPSGAKPAYYCSTVIDGESIDLLTTTFIDYIEEANVPATVVGTAGTCTITVPYSWVVPAAVKNEIIRSITGTYSISAINTTVTSIVDIANEMRTTVGPAISIDTIPASGVTTSETIAAWI